MKSRVMAISETAFLGLQCGQSAACLAACLTIWLAGCSSGPSKITAPSFDPSGSADQAMELFDKDGDGFLAGAELDAAPGIKAAMKTLDGDQDGKVTAEEINARIQAWVTRGVGLMGCACAVTLDGKPLDGATITFDPEPIFGDLLQPAMGPVTGGTASPTIPKQNRIPADAPPGLRVGLYRVRISKPVNGVETIPAQYNKETTLGQQVSTDDPAIAGQRVRYELTSK